MSDRSTPSPTPSSTRGADPEAADPLLARALQAVGRARVLGLHFYGHIIGIGGRQAHDGRSEVTIEGEPNGSAGRGASPVALATVADLAIGAAIRSHLELGCRLGTVTLSVQHPVVPVVGPIVARGEAASSDDEIKSGRCVLSTPDGSVVGYAQGSFAALPPPPGVVLALLPWERDPMPQVPAVTLADLDEQEEAAVAAARSAGERAHRRGTTLSDELLPFDWRPQSVEGCASGEFSVGPELANRVRHVQGGALYGAATLVARQALGVPSATLLEGHYQFVRPADGAILHAEGTVLRRGRLAAFVESRLAVDGKLVGAGLFSFRL